jgi:rhamnosyltransferase
MIVKKNCNKDYFVCAVIVTYNPELIILSRQLQSLINQVDKIVIVENCSNNIDGIKKTIEDFSYSSKQEIHLICNSTNEGLGKAQNRGIKFAKDDIKTTHVILFDQDSILDEEFVNGLIDSEKKLLGQGIKLSAIGPVYYDEITNETYPITKYRGPFIDRIKPSSEPVEATFLIASGCLISVNIFDVVGYMNEDLFIDYIDVEWSFRAKSFGYQVYASPNSKMKHTIGDNRTSIFGRSISIHSPLRRYYLYRNSIYMVKNPNISFGYKIREITFNLMRFIVFLVLSKERMKYFKYSISGFIDGFKGVKGKCPHIYN